MEAASYSRSTTLAHYPSNLSGTSYGGKFFKMNLKIIKHKFLHADIIWSKIIEIYNKLNQIGKNYFCPVCGNHFMLFRNGECRYCSSFGRHRKLAYYIQSHKEEIQNASQVCEFAPGTGDFKLLFSRLGIPVKQYLYADLNPARYPMFKVLKVDLQSDELPLMDNTFDIIIIVSVLEHIPDDIKALRNIYRILKTGGIAYVHVPIDENLEQTIEYGKPNPDEYDHVRAYGKDFANRAAKVGFHIKKESYPNSARNKKLISWMQIDLMPFFILKKY